MTDERRWRAVLDNDPAFDGAFFYAVASTGVFCRPSCASRPPRRDRVRFFDRAEDALAAGFRPCKRCRPDLAVYAPEQETVRRARELIEAHYRDPAALSAALAGLGLSRRRLEALFLRVEGCTPAAYADQLRVERAKALLRRGDLPTAQVAFEAGFGSLSAFYRRFRAATGAAPGQYRRQEESP